MATLLDTTIPNLNVLGDTEIQGALKRNMPFMSGSKSDGGSVYSTIGVIPFNSVTSSGITTSATNDKFTITESGVYITQFWAMCAPSPTGVARVYIRKNGVSGAQARANGTYSYEVFWTYRLWDMDVGDYFEAYLGAGEMYATSTIYTRFLIWRVA